MARPTVTPLNEERLFEFHELFFSVTDKRGVIEFGNDVFARIAGYSLDEMVGEPHNIIRHPDMPRAVFKVLWDYLDAGRTIVAYVKNMAADGRYYWVLALVLPSGDRYVSIRLKPSSELFAAVQEVYQKVLAFEKQREQETGSRKIALEESMPYLVSLIEEAGFNSYDELMWSALHQEMDARRAALKNIVVKKKGRIAVSTSSPLWKLAANCKSMAEHLDALFASLGGFTDLNKSLAGQATFLKRLAESIRRSSLNAEIASSHLGERGLALAEIAGQMSAQTAASIGLIASLHTSISDLQGPLLRLVFDVLVATLDIEMASLFIDEVTAVGSEVEEVAEEDQVMTEYITALVSLFEERATTLIPNLFDISGKLQTIRDLLVRLQRYMRMLSVVQFSGQVEAVRIPDSLNFLAIFEEVLEQLNEANRQVSGFGKLVGDRLQENAALQASAQGISSLLEQTHEHMTALAQTEAA
ncbi:MAG: PAS domain-containing protein [Rhodothermales bacterium]